MSGLNPPEDFSKKTLTEEVLGRLRFENDGDYSKKLNLNSSKAAYKESASLLKPLDLDIEEDLAAVGGDFEMEAPISEEDLIRAGGLGARDDLNSLLPTAMDATDLEAFQRDAWDYEDVEADKISRPGLGLKDGSQYQGDSLESATRLSSQEDSDTANK